jgi:hypothetical protein
MSFGGLKGEAKQRQNAPIKPASEPPRFKTIGNLQITS